MKLIKLLASIKLTSLLILWLIVGVLLNIRFEDHIGLITPPLIAISLNLIAALIITPKIRRDIYLLVFHLSLLFVVLLATLNHISRSKGRVEIFEGGEFQGQLDDEEKGPYLLSTLEDLRFRLDAIEINYQDDGQRIGTFARIQITEPIEERRSFIIADQHPFKYRGYRFYTTHNKGYALITRWQSSLDNSKRIGAIHLPSYPANALEQKINWTPQGSQQNLWLHLLFKQLPLGSATGGVFSPPKDAELVVRFDQKRHQLKVGQSLVLADGQLTFIGIRSWMGLKVQYDGLITWILAAAITAILSLSVYLLRRRRNLLKITA